MRATDTSAFVANLETIHSVVGDVPPGPEEGEVVATEHRLGLRLHPSIRAHFGLFGNDARIRVTGALAALRIERGVLILRDEPDWQLGLKLSDKDSEPIIRSFNVEIGFVGPDTLLERRACDAPWRPKVQSIEPYFLECTHGLAIHAAPNQFYGRIPFISSRARERLTKELEAVGIRTDRYVEPSLRALVRYQYIGANIDVGAYGDGAREALDVRLGSKLIAVKIAGELVKPKKKRLPRTKAKKNAGPVEVDFDRALATILQARYGREAHAARGTTLEGQLPKLLTAFHARVGDDALPLDGEHHFVPPEKLKCEDGHTIIAWENQWVVSWSIKETDRDKPDPPVWQRNRGGSKAKKISPALSSFLIGAATWQVLFGMEERARTEIAPDALEDVLERLRQVLPSLDGGRFATSDTEALVSVPRRALAIVRYAGDGASIHVGASRKTMKTLERTLELELDWL